MRTLYTLLTIAELRPILQIRQLAELGAVRAGIPTPELSLRRWMTSKL